MGIGGRDAKPSCDVIIVGAGMVGAALACALGRLELDVIVLEDRPPPPYDPAAPLDIRVSAISVASERVFTRLGVWETLPAQRLCPYSRMFVWEDDGSIRFDAAEVPWSHLGTIVENSLLQAFTLARLRDFPNVQLRSPARAVALHAHRDCAELELAGGERLTTRLVIGADGTHSPLREMAGIPTYGYSYNQSAIVCAIDTEKPHQYTAWQHFLPDGPLAFLPLADGRCSVVWSNTTDAAQRILEMDDPAFLRVIEDASGGILGGMKACGPRASFPLRFRHAASYVGPRMALIGDAAHTIHPLAGQGANLGFMDVAALVESISRALKRGQDLADPAVLSRFQRWRRGDNLLMSGVVGGFKSLFGAANPMLHFARNKGMGTLNQMTPLKRLVVERAIGLRGDLQGLARP